MKEVFENTFRLYLAKSGEYNRVSPLRSYYPYGKISIANGLNEKMVRYINQVSDNQDGLDTLMDLMILAAMGIVVTSQL